MATPTVIFSHILCTLGVLCLNQTVLANESLIQTESISSQPLPTENMTPLALSLDLGWDSKYISQGRDNLKHGGIYWANASIQYNNLTTYALVGRGDSQTYTEWNIGFEYTFNVVEQLEANLGYQRIEGFSDNRCQDNELFGELAYTATPWLIPSVSYVYATEAEGSFVEVSLHSYWNITDQFTLTPYITQGFDFKYRTEKHNGRNHLQLGLEASYQITSEINLSGHISHSIAQNDIEQEMAENGDTGSQDQTYAGIHVAMKF